MRALPDIPRVVRILRMAAMIAVVPFAAAAALIARCVSHPVSMSAEEVVAALRSFIEGTGGPRDWDDFTSIPLADPALERIRRAAAAIDLPPDEAGMAKLRALLVEAEAPVTPARP